MDKSYEILLRSEMNEIRKEIRDMRQELTKYKGFVGGVVWTFAALSTATHFVLNWLLKAVHLS